MPLFEFRCEACSEVTEILMKYSDPAPLSCEVCKKGPMSKMMSSSNFAFKGQGRFATDLKNKTRSPQRQYLKVTDGSDIPDMPKDA